MIPGIQQYRGDKLLVDEGAKPPRYGKKRTHNLIRNNMYVVDVHGFDRLVAGSRSSFMTVATC